MIRKPFLFVIFVILIFVTLFGFQQNFAKSFGEITRVSRQNEPTTRTEFQFLADLENRISAEISEVESRLSSKMDQISKSTELQFSPAAAVAKEPVFENEEIKEELKTEDPKTKGTL